MARRTLASTLAASDLAEIEALARKLDLPYRTTDDRLRWHEKQALKQAAIEEARRRTPTPELTFTRENTSDSDSALSILSEDRIALTALGFDIGLLHRNGRIVIEICPVTNTLSFEASNEDNHYRLAYSIDAISTVEVEPFGDLVHLRLHFDSPPSIVYHYRAGDDPWRRTCDFTLSDIVVVNDLSLHKALIHLIQPSLKLPEPCPVDQFIKFDS